MSFIKISSVNQYKINVVGIGSADLKSTSEKYSLLYKISKHDLINFSAVLLESIQRLIVATVSSSGTQFVECVIKKAI